MGGVLGVAKLKYTMERLLVTARELSTKVESNEAAAGDLLKQCETLQQQLKALRQYRDCLQEISGGVESRVRLPNIEFSYVRQLQQDNSELRSLLEEHQATLQMVMTKYRQQVKDFMTADKETGTISEDGQLAQDLACRTEQVYGLATIMYRAAEVEDETVQEVAEKLARFEYENKHLREVLGLSAVSSEGREEEETIHLHACTNSDQQNQENQGNMGV